MGVNKLWDDDDLERQSKTLKEFAAGFYEQHGRAPKVAIDGNILLHQLKGVNDYINDNNSSEALFYRLSSNKILAFIEVGIDCVMVFDGPRKPSFKRNVQYNFGSMGSPKEEYTLTSICRDVGIEVIKAAGEGEAECCWLEMEGVVDYVFTEDSDCLLFGAKKILRYKARELVGPSNGSDKNINEEGDGDYYNGEEEEGDEEKEEDDDDEENEEEIIKVSTQKPSKQLTTESHEAIQVSKASGKRDGSRRTRKSISGTSAADRMIEIIHVNKISEFDRPQYILRALLQGGDYDNGIKQLGYEIAKRISSKKTGFAEELANIYGWNGENHLSREHKDFAFDNSELDDNLRLWRQKLVQELNSNESKFLAKRCNAVIPNDFPRKDVVESYFHPVVLEEKHSQKIGFEEFPNVLNIFDNFRKVYREPGLQNKTISKIDWNNRLWVTFINNIIFPFLVLRIRLQQDKESWYEKISATRKSKNSSLLNLYNVTLKAETMREIVGLESMEAPQLRSLSRVNSATSSCAGSATSSPIKCTSQSFSGSQSFSVSQALPAVLNKFKRVKKISSTILGQSAHNLLTNFAKSSTAKPLATREHISAFTKQVVKVPIKRQRTLSERKRSRNIVPTNNKSVTEFFSSTKANRPISKISAIKEYTEPPTKKPHLETAFNGEFTSSNTEVLDFWELSDLEVDGSGDVHSGSADSPIVL